MELEQHRIIKHNTYFYHFYISITVYFCTVQIFITKIFLRYSEQLLNNYNQKLKFSFIITLYIKLNL